MANNLGSNYGKKVMDSIAAGFENARVSTKSVNTTNIQGKFNASTGAVIYEKRKTSYRSGETADGDVSGAGAWNNDILVGQIPYTKQNVITVRLTWDTVEEALELNQLDELIMPAGEELITRAELNFNTYMVNNSGLTVGTPGTQVGSWEDVASCQALMDEIGIPKAGKRYYQMNSYSAMNLAGIQVGLNAEDRVRTAWDQSMVSSPLAGLTSIRSNSLKTLTTDAVADGIGALAANPNVTWATHKDTMIQSISVSGLTASVDVVAGSTIEITGKYHTNPRTQQIVYDQNGNAVPFRWTVTADATTSSAGAVTLLVTNAAIFDAASNNQYDNISAAPVSGDVVTIQEGASTTYKPNLFYHKDAFSFATIQLPKLYATDMVYQSKDGLTFRASRYADGDANANILRLDLVPAFGVANPLHAGRSYGLS
jgi:hypothetical protein